MLSRNSKAFQAQSRHTCFGILLLFATVAVVQCSVVDDCRNADHVTITACDNVTVHCCLADLKKHDTGKTDAVIQYMNEKDARQHCRRYNQFEDCMRPSRENCGRADKLLFEGIEAAHDYWCNETFEEYLEYQPCFDNRDLHADGDQCRSYFDQSMNTIDYTRGLAHVYKRRCHFVENYLDCDFNAVKQYCGEAAARWHVGYDARTLKPLLDISGCLFLIERWRGVIDCGNKTDNPENCTIPCLNSLKKYVCECEGYQFKGDQECVDVHECDMRSDNCQHRCINTVGSYLCSCSDGYTLNDDAHSCDDIDECKERTHKCNDTQSCVNVVGSFTCEWKDVSGKGNGNSASSGLTAGVLGLTAGVVVLIIIVVMGLAVAVVIYCRRRHLTWSTEQNLDGSHTLDKGVLAISFVNSGVWYITGQGMGTAASEDLENSSSEFDEHKMDTILVK